MLLVDVLDVAGSEVVRVVALRGLVRGRDAAAMVILGDSLVRSLRRQVLVVHELVT